MGRGMDEWEDAYRPEYENKGWDAESQVDERGSDDHGNDWESNGASIVEEPDHDIREEEDIKHDAIAGMAGRVGTDKNRGDRITYGALGGLNHEKLYEGWRTSSRIPNLPSWKEMDEGSKSVWAGSQTGRKIIGDANRELKKNNFSEIAERPVRDSTTGVRGGVTVDPSAATRKAEQRARNNVKSAVATTTIAPEQAANVNSKFGFGDDFSNHEKLGVLVDRLEKAHNGTSSSVAPLVAAARQSISKSIAAQATGAGKAAREEAMQHFSDAAGHTMRLAQAVSGAASNAGEKADAMSTISEVNSHMTNYRKYVTNIKKVN